MCVIMIVDKQRPTDKMIEKAWEKNKHGGGLAWREVNKTSGKKEVHWKKGVETVAEMKTLIAELPLPFIAHFRIASVDGGGVNPKLTHPFPITKTVPLFLDGITQGDVLFHNGNWKDWDGECRAAAINSNNKVPTGKWSDTRGMAWLCAIYGNGFMELLPNQKGVIFGPNGYDIFTGNGWEEIEDGDVKVWCSNDYFWPKATTYNHGNHHTSYNQGQNYGSFHGSNVKPMCVFPRCIRTDIDDKKYCPDHKDGVNQKYKNEAAGPGGAQPVIPFLVGGNHIISLEQAKRLNDQGTRNLKGEKLVSNNKLKRIRGLHSEMQSNSPRRIQAAAKELQKLTLKISLESRILSIN